MNVEGYPVQVDDRGEFTARLNLEMGKNSFEIIASDESGTLETKSVTMIRSKASLSDINYGRCFALVIGNNRYQYISPLRSAENDAREVAQILSRDYGFEVNILLNAKRADIISGLNSYRKRLGENDNLLIYYAGHGWLDKEADEGYWLPVDAERDNTVNWVANSAITASLKAIAAKHILVVADSCYSGKLSRSGMKGIHQQNLAYYSRMSRKKARSVLASGGLEPVLDGGGRGRHSIFAAAFINSLKENPSVMDGTQLFGTLRRKVVVNAEQTPEYADIHKAGHDGGDFLFIRREP